MKAASRQLAMREVLCFAADTLDDYVADGCAVSGAGRFWVTPAREEALRTLAKELRERARQAAGEGVGSR